MDDATGTKAVEIQPGADVFGSDGERLGAIIEVSEAYIVVEKGLFFPTDYFVPIDMVTAAESGKVTLSVTREDALTRGWDQDPSTRDRDSSPTGEPADSDSRSSDRTSSRLTETESIGMASMLGTVPPAADFATLGVAPIDVNSDYQDARPLDADDSGRADSGSGKR